jgi:hypothetical protein
MTDTRPGRAADAADYAGYLKSDLARVTMMLDRYRGSPGLEIMHGRSLNAQRKLHAIQDRARALGCMGDRGRYVFSESEQTTLEIARDLRDRLIESLARYQRAAALPARKVSD